MHAACHQHKGGYSIAVAVGLFLDIGFSEQVIAFEIYERQWQAYGTLATAYILLLCCCFTSTVNIDGAGGGGGGVLNTEKYCKEK